MEQNQGMLTCGNPSCSHQFPVDLPAQPGRYSVNCPVCGSEVIFDILPAAEPEPQLPPAAPFPTPGGNPHYDAPQPPSRPTITFGTPDGGTIRKDYTNAPAPHGYTPPSVDNAPAPAVESHSQTELLDNDMTKQPPKPQFPGAPDVNKTVVSTPDVNKIVVGAPDANKTVVGAAGIGGQMPIVGGNDDVERSKKPILKWILIALIPIAMIIGGVLLGIKDRDGGKKTASAKLEEIMAEASPVADEAEAVVEEAADVIEEAETVVEDEKPSVQHAQQQAPQPAAQPATPQPAASSSSTASSSSSSSSMNQNDALDLLKHGIQEANDNIFPQDAGSGITITRAYISGDYVVYSCECDENLIDVSVLESVKSEMKEEMKNMIRSRSDQSIVQMVRLCVNAGKGLGFQYIGDTTGNKVGVYLTNAELRRLL